MVIEVWTSAFVEYELAYLCLVAQPKNQRMSARKYTTHPLGGILFEWLGRDNVTYTRCGLGPDSPMFFVLAYILPIIVPPLPLCKHKHIRVHLSPSCTCSRKVGQKCLESRKTLLGRNGP